jgi:hypothetical protein
MLWAALRRRRRGAEDEQGAPRRNDRVAPAGLAGAAAGNIR